MKTLQADKLHVSIYSGRDEMGRAAANAGIDIIRQLLSQQEVVNLIFAAAPSQAEVLSGLKAADISWERVNAFHMDNYVGLDDNAPQQFSRFLRDRLLGLLPFKSVHYLGNRSGQQIAYAHVLAAHPTDVCFMGIGENAHVAFNDPGNAFFNDSQLVKEVALDLACRTQQVNEGNFPTLQDVPTHALTLTIPTLMAARHLICTVPGVNKAAAVKAMLEGTVREDCPATILRTHPSARMFIDEAAASMLT